jgi:hypothetical protein
MRLLGQSDAWRYLWRGDTSISALDESERSFEAKSLSGVNEVHQCRAALSQLLEYRFCYGTESDRFCSC